MAPCHMIPENGRTYRERAAPLREFFLRLYRRAELRELRRALARHQRTTDAARPASMARRCRSGPRRGNAGRHRRSADAVSAEQRRRLRRRNWLAAPFASRAWWLV